jgi:tRNA G18 (ribose-2'-O)-methylase SpoU
MARDRKLNMDELGRIDASAYRAMDKVAVRVLLDDVRSRHNVGSIFRTADAASRPARRTGRSKKRPWVPRVQCLGSIGRPLWKRCWS